MISRLNGATQQTTVETGGGGKKKKGGGAGPERRWLIHKTGSQHPWSFLAKHHERIIVGPRGSRIVRGK